MPHLFIVPYAHLSCNGLSGVSLTQTQTHSSPDNPIEAASPVDGILSAARFYWPTCVCIILTATEL